LRAGHEGRVDVLIAQNKTNLGILPRTEIMTHDTFRVGDITAIIGDNSADGDHRAGYNGVWSLTHKHEPSNLFVPTVAGLNFEHIFDCDKRDADNSRKIFFEPRYAPMTFKKLSDTAAELVQPPTPTFHLESRTRFQLVAPHYVDMEFRCTPTQHVFAHGYIGLFWASYINAPDDKSMYFLTGKLWQQLCSAAHNNQSTVRHKDDSLDLKFSEGLGDALFKNLSVLRFERPFFYGNYRDMVFIVMFEKVEGIRFTHSPSGGGVNTEKQTTNPAWDFQFILPKYDVKAEYGFKARAVYRPKCSRAEILKEYEQWAK
jgi:hypothetical protein